MHELHFCDGLRLSYLPTSDVSLNGLFLQPIAKVGHPMDTGLSPAFSEPVSQLRIIETTAKVSSSLVNQLASVHGLYGRDEQIELLLEIAEWTHRGHGKLLLVSGPSGTGKTSLVHVLKEPARSKNGIFIEGKFNQFDQNVPYGAFRQALGDFVESLHRDGPNNLSRLKTNLAEACKGHGYSLVKLVPELATLIGPQPVPVGVNAQDAKIRFAAAFRAFMQVFCRPEHPVVLFIDDWQWADSASLELLTQMGIGSTLKYFLVVAAYRSNEVDESHPFSNALRLIQSESTPVRRIEVSNLSETELLPMIRERMISVSVW